jgi:teichuronic acid biosynthesis glycosyltransferase TuaG
MRAARGQYLAFLDSDDLWLPSKLSAQTEFMQRHGVGFCFTRYRRLKPGGQLGAAVRIPDQLRYHDLLKGNVIGCLTVMIDRNKVPAFTMHSIGHEDYLAWLQILKNGITAWGLQEDLARYRVSAESTSGNKQRSALWTWQILRRYEGLTLHKSMICFLRYFLRAAYIRCGL